MGRAWGIGSYTIKHFHRSVDGVQLAMQAEDHMEFTGGCVCGGTRYVLKSRPVALVDCHCIDCRRSAGAPYVQWGSMPRKDLILTKGEPRKVRVRESDSFVCRVLRYAFVFRRQRRLEQHRCHNCIAGRSGAICAAKSNFPRRQIAVGCDRRIDSVIPDCA